MGGLILPRSTIADLERAEMEKQAEFHTELAEHWTKELRRIDPYLEIVWVGERVDHPDLYPARWHVFRNNPEGPPSAWPLIGDEGEYREPGAWVLDEMRAADMYNDRVHRDKADARRRLQEAKNRQKKLEAEQRKDEATLAVRAARRMRGDSGMYTRTDLKGKR